MYEHGDAWVQRVRRLKSVGHMPRRIIFPVRMPEAGQPLQAAEEICGFLRGEAAEVVPFENMERLRELAQV